MKSNFREVSFSTHAHIKNIIGKELINEAFINQNSISDQLPMLWNLPIDLDSFES